ncbi:MAG: DUF421 domain-containing protein [Bacilli bacterium]
MAFFNEKFGMLVIETFCSIIALFVFTKIIGRKQISQLNIFDFIIGITLGNIAAEMAVNEDVSLISGIGAMFIYAITSVIVSHLTTKSIIARRFLSGLPIVIMENGSFIEGNMKRLKMDINDFLEQCRINGYFDISEIEYAIMEASGEISFLPKTKFKPLDAKTMKLKTTYKGLTSNLVIDGKIMINNLKLINKDKEWLLTRIKNKHACLENILLLTCDTDEMINIYMKNEIKKKETGLE